MNWTVSSVGNNEKPFSYCHVLIWICVKLARQLNRYAQLVVHQLQNNRKCTLHDYIFVHRKICKTVIFLCHLYDYYIYVEGTQIIYYIKSILYVTTCTHVTMYLEQRCCVSTTLIDKIPRTLFIEPHITKKLVYIPPHFLISLSIFSHDDVLICNSSLDLGLSIWSLSS